jgi:hypothetical protein
MIPMDGSGTEHCVVSRGTVLYRRVGAVATELPDKYVLRAEMAANDQERNSSVAVGGASAIALRDRGDLRSGAANCRWY